MEGSLGRGGSRNREKQCRLDDLCVQATVEKHGLEHGCSFGLYESVARSQAVVGKGLLQNRQLLLSLLNLYPPLDFLMSSLKKGFTRAVLQKPTLNTGQYANNIWAGFRAERVLTLCNQDCQRTTSVSTVHQQDDTSRGGAAEGGGGEGAARTRGGQQQCV